MFLFFKLLTYINKKRKIQLILLSLLMFLSALLEVIGLGALVPFLTVLSSPEKISDANFLFLFSVFKFSDSENFIFLFTLFFCSIILISGFLRLTFLWLHTYLSFIIGADLSVLMYKKTLYQSYETHLSRNSSVVISAILQKSSGLVTYLVFPVLGCLSSAIILFAILFFLILINPIITLVTFITLFFIYLLISIISRSLLSAYSVIISKSSDRLVKALQEGLGGIRDVLMGNFQEVYCDIFKSAEYPLRKSQAMIQVIAGAPRFIIESVGVTFIAIIAYYSSIGFIGSSSNVIPLVGTLAFGALRMLPLSQQLYSSWSIFKGNKSSIEDAFYLLDQRFPESISSGNKPLRFENLISLNNVSFKYSGSPSPVLKDVSLNIKKGQVIGFVGVTGSGKSTLLDILMGLLDPSAGSVEIDSVQLNQSNRSLWQAKIAHVPQAIHLIDASIAENIAFGVDIKSIDMNKVNLAASSAQILDYIKTLTHGFNTNVGERGIRLSGGQRQRIGIARALYKNADLIIFDEATSALDIETEKLVMESIESLPNKPTLIIVAHRLSTLRNCSIIYDIKNGQIDKFGTYEELFQQS